MLTPPAPVGAKLIYSPMEGGYLPSPVYALASWKTEMGLIKPQAGLL